MRAARVGGKLVACALVQVAPGRWCGRSRAARRPWRPSSSQRCRGPRRSRPSGSCCAQGAPWRGAEVRTAGAAAVGAAPWSIPTPAMLLPHVADWRWVLPPEQVWQLEPVLAAQVLRLFPCGLRSLHRWRAEVGVLAPAGQPSEQRQVQHAQRAVTFMANSAECCSSVAAAGCVLEGRAAAKAAAPRAASACIPACCCSRAESLLLPLPLLPAPRSLAGSACSDRPLLAPKAPRSRRAAAPSESPRSRRAACTATLAVPSASTSTASTAPLLPTCEPPSSRVCSKSLLAPPFHAARHPAASSSHAQSLTMLRARVAALESGLVPEAVAGVERLPAARCCWSAGSWLCTLSHAQLLAGGRLTLWRFPPCRATGKPSCVRGEDSSRQHCFAVVASARGLSLLRSRASSRTCPCPGRRRERPPAQRPQQEARRRATSKPSSNLIPYRTLFRAAHCVSWLRVDHGGPPRWPVALRARHPHRPRNAQQPCPSRVGRGLRTERASAQAGSASPFVHAQPWRPKSAAQQSSSTVLLRHCHLCAPCQPAQVYSRAAAAILARPQASGGALKHEQRHLALSSAPRSVGVGLLSRPSSTRPRSPVPRGPRRRCPPHHLAPKAPRAQTQMAHPEWAPTFRPTRDEFAQPFVDYVSSIFRAHPDLPCFKVSQAAVAGR